MGGTFAEWEGWDWISDFGDLVAEHHAVREAVGIWESATPQVVLPGAGRGRGGRRSSPRIWRPSRWGMPVRGVRRREREDARRRRLYRGEAEDAVLVVTALDRCGHFRRICWDLDVEIEERTCALPHLQVQGPRSRELLAGLTDADVAGLRYFRFIPQPITVGGVEGCWVSRTGYSGEIGYEVFCPAEGAESLWRALLDAGAHMGIRPYGLAAVETLRIEAV